jgi:hypothetical protein
LLAVAADAGTPLRVTAREELMAPMAIAMAATKNNEQKTRRHLDGANMDVGFGFVIIDLPILFFARTSRQRGNRAKRGSQCLPVDFPFLIEDATHSPKQREDACQSFSTKKQGTREVVSRVPALTIRVSLLLMVTAAAASDAVSALAYPLAFRWVVPWASG